MALHTASAKAAYSTVLYLGCTDTHTGTRKSIKAKYKKDNNTHSLIIVTVKSDTKMYVLTYKRSMLTVEKKRSNIL